MKNRTIKYGLSLLALTVVLTACKEQVIPSFDAASSLFFYRGTENNKGATQIDSTFYSFFLAGSTQQDTVWLDVRLTGIPANYDRIIPIEQTNVDSTGAAIAGVHYVSFTDAAIQKHFIMPAKQVSASIPIVVTRNEAMNFEEFRLDLAITTNENFVAGIKDRTTYSIKITAKAVKPVVWDNPNSFKVVFGEWGQKKMEFIIDYVGWTEFDAAPTTDYRWFLNLKAREKLAEYEAKNGPLYEADMITQVVFPKL